MKRIICFCFCLCVLLVPFSGCGVRTVSKYMDEETAEAYKKAIDVLDAVLNKEMDIDKAAKRIEMYANSIEETDDFGKNLRIQLLNSTAAVLDSMYSLKKAEATNIGDKEIFLNSSDYAKIKELKKTLENTLYD